MAVQLLLLEYVVISSPSWFYHLLCLILHLSTAPDENVSRQHVSFVVVTTWLIRKDNYECREWRSDYQTYRHLSLFLGHRNAVHR